MVGISKISPVQVRGTTPRTTGTDLLFVAAYVGTAFIRILAVPALRIAVVDLLLVAAIAVGHRHLRVENPARHLLRRAMPWAWLYVVANLVALLPIGLPVWAVDQLARDLFVLLVFFSLLAYFVDRAPARRLLWMILPVMVAWVSVTTFVGASGVRESGFFENPNYTAHFIVAAIICVLSGQYSVRLRVAVLAIAVPGVLATGSFGAFVFAGTALAYAIWSLLGRFSPQMRILTRILLICIVPVLVSAAGDRFQEVEDDEAAIGNVDSARFERSSGTRTTIWAHALGVAADHPMGIGNGGFRLRTDVVPTLRGIGRPEVHNDYLAIAVESGVIGLVGFGGVIVTIWRGGRPGGPTRLLLIGTLSTGLTREVINFRHTWVLLALVLATEWSTRDRGGGSLETVAVGPL